MSGSSLGKFTSARKVIAAEWSRVKTEKTPPKSLRCWFNAPRAEAANSDNASMKGSLADPVGANHYHHWTHFNINVFKTPKSLYPNPFDLGRSHFVMLLVVAAAGLDVPDDLHLAVAEADEAVPTADRGVLLRRDEQHLVADAQRSSAGELEYHVVAVH